MKITHLSHSHIITKIFLTVRKVIQQLKKETYNYLLKDLEIEEINSAIMQYQNMAHLEPDLYEIQTRQLTLTPTFTYAYSAWGAQTLQTWLQIHGRRRLEEEDTKTEKH